MLNGVGFVNELSLSLSLSFDFMQRTPKGDFTHCKYNLIHLYYTEIRMQLITNRQTGEKRPWRIPRSTHTGIITFGFRGRRKMITGQVWDNPLLILLPKNWERELWKYDIVTEKDNLDENGNEIKPPSAFEQIKSNPMAAAPLVMNMFSAKKGKEFRDGY